MKNHFDTEPWQRRGEGDLEISRLRADVASVESDLAAIHAGLQNQINVLYDIALGQRYLAYLSRSSNVAVAGGFAFTQVNFNAFDGGDSNAVFQGGQNYTCPVRGTYMVTANIQLDTPTPSAIQVTLNGGQWKEGGRTTNAGALSVGHNITAPVWCDAGGVLGAGIWNDGGAATNVREGGAFTWMYVHRIGPHPDDV